MSKRSKNQEPQKPQLAIGDIVSFHLDWTSSATKNGLSLSDVNGKSFTFKNIRIGEGRPVCEFYENGVLDLSRQPICLNIQEVTELLTNQLMSVVD